MSRIHFREVIIPRSVTSFRVKMLPLGVVFFGQEGKLEFLFSLNSIFAHFDGEI